MREEDIKVFLKIIEAGTISGAAEELFTTQSNISKRMRQLESDMGVQLFFRHKGKRSIELSGYGEKFLHVARKWEALQKEFDEIPKSDVRTEISICATDIINLFTFRDFYRDFMARHPDVRLDIHTHHSKEIYPLLESHRVDIAFAGVLLPMQDISARPLYREPMYILCTAENYRGDTVRPQDLDPGQEIYAKWSDEYEIWHDIIWPGRHYPIHCGTGSMLADYLDAPGRWALAPVSCVRGLANRHGFMYSRLSVNPPQRTYYQLEQKNLRESRIQVVKMFEEELHEALRRDSGLEFMQQGEQVRR